MTRKTPTKKPPDISQFPSRNLNTQPAPTPKKASARFTEMPPLSII